MRLAAAAVPLEATVRLEGATKPFTITKVHNSTPHAGRITWEDGKRQYEIGAAVKVEIIALP